LKLEIAKIKGTELNGSYVPEYVCLLRQLNHEWHKTSGGLFRYPAEDEPTSPHIYCGKGEETLKFDICAEHKTIYSDLNFNDALAAFFYVAFIGNLEYPAKGEAVAVWLQRKIAGINFEGKFFIWQQKKVMCQHQILKSTGTPKELFNGCPFFK
jgi:hypothetical protein